MGLVLDNSLLLCLHLFKGRHLCCQQSAQRVLGRLAGGGDRQCVQSHAAAVASRCSSRRLTEEKDPRQLESSQSCIATVLLQCTGID